jgi:ribosome-associated toxin RatA of RatAB toxin-antitoxin module
MQKIVIEKTIFVPIKGLWNILFNISELADDITNVHKIEVVDNHDYEQTLKWLIWLKGFELQWTEKRQIDARIYRISFLQINGMLAHYSGSWQLTSKNSKETVIKLNLDIDMGMSYLNMYIDPVITKAFKEFYEEFLLTLEEKQSQIQKNLTV